MKIFFLTFEFPPYFGGGLSTYMDQLCKVYKDKEDDITIFLVDGNCQGRIVEKEVAENIKLVRFRPWVERYYSEFGYWTAVSNEMAQHMAFYAQRRGAPDIIEAPDGFGIGYIALQKRLCKDPVFSEIPIVTTAHTPTYMINRLNEEAIYKLPNYWHGMMEKFSIAACDSLVSPSQALLDQLASEVDCDLPPSTVIRNPFQLETPSRLEAPTTALTEPAKLDHFYVASRLVYWKGVDHIVRIFNEIWAQGKDIKLVLYGDDSPFEAGGVMMSEHLSKKYYNQISDGLLEIAGKRPRAEINERAKSAYAQIHPSLFDNFPYSVIENMASGGITIVNECGGHNEIINNWENAVQIDVNDISLSAETILKVTDLSASERARIGQCAIDTIARECSYEHFYHAKQKLYEQVISRHEERKTFPFVTGKPREIEPKEMHGTAGLLSVVIPYFNMHAFIDETLQSLEDSTYPDVEVILVDDGSNAAEAKDKLEELKAQTFRFKLKVLHTENQGVAAARNTGVQHASGQFLALLDADDLIRPTYYQRAIDILKSYSNVSFVGCWNEDFKDEDGSRIRIWPTFNTEMPMQMIFNSTNCQGLVYWRSVFEDAGHHDPDLRMFLDDWESTISLIAAGYRGVMIPEALFRYRIRNESIFRSKKDLWTLNYEKITRKHKALFDEWGSEVAAFMNANGPNTFYHIPGFPSGLGNAREGGTPQWFVRARQGGHMGTLRVVAAFFEKNPIGKAITRSTNARKIGRLIHRKLT